MKHPWAFQIGSRIPWQLKPVNQSTWSSGYFTWQDRPEKPPHGHGCKHGDLQLKHGNFIREKDDKLVDLAGVPINFRHTHILHPFILARKKYRFLCEADNLHAFGHPPIYCNLPLLGLQLPGLTWCCTNYFQRFAPAAVLPPPAPGGFLWTGPWQINTPPRQVKLKRLGWTDGCFGTCLARAPRNRSTLDLLTGNVSNLAKLVWLSPESHTHTHIHTYTGTNHCVTYDF